MKSTVFGKFDTVVEVNVEDGHRFNTTVYQRENPTCQTKVIINNVSKAELKQFGLDLIEMSYELSK